jgi:hypothetical protein
MPPPLQCRGAVSAALLRANGGLIARQMPIGPPHYEVLAVCSLSEMRTGRRFGLFSPRVRTALFHEAQPMSFRS